jgi:transcriptional regulator with XRE-family HTH domain
MGTIGERVRHLRKVSLNLTLEKFGERIGITAASLSAFETGKTNPSDQTIRSICREFGVREKWLRTGEGSMYVHLTPDEERAVFLARITAGESSPEVNAFIDALKATPNDDLKTVIAFIGRVYDAHRENLKNDESPDAD